MFKPCQPLPKVVFILIFLIGAPLSAGWASETAPGTPAEWAEFLPEKWMSIFHRHIANDACEKAVPLLEAAGNAGDWLSLSILAEFHEKGVCVPVDVEAAERYRKRSNEIKEGCEHRIRSAYLRLKGMGTPRGSQKAKKSFTIGARCRTPVAEEIIEISEYWKAADKDRVRVIEDQIFWALRVEEGDARTQFDLAQRLVRGDEFPVSPKTAVRWTKQATKKGLVDAQYTLAHWLLFGGPVERDPTLGRIRLRELAKAGHVLSQAALGRWFGTLPSPSDFDNERAYAWLLIAAAGGSDVENLLRQVEMRLPDQERKWIKSLVGTRTFPKWL